VTWVLVIALITGGMFSGTPGGITTIPMASKEACVAAANAIGGPSGSASSAVCVNQNTGEVILGKRS
jgi:D-alanyl-D-alanine carboxypeptidase